MAVVTEICPETSARLKMSQQGPHICFVATHPLSVERFLLPHIRGLAEIGSVEVYCGSFAGLPRKNITFENVVTEVPLVRKISLLDDTRALWALYLHIIKSKPTCVHSITPKAGLLGMLAAWFARVPMRVHTFTGQVWVTRSGFMAILLKYLDRLTAVLATDVLVDSPSQLEFLLRARVVERTKARVLGKGSVCGVNIKRFVPNPVIRREVRQMLNAKPDAIVCLYLGRLTIEKGVLDLAQAFSKVSARHPSAQLWFVGPDEEGCEELIKAHVKNALGQVKVLGFTDAPQKYMQASDLFCLPSYREGFGCSVIEAAACGIPCLGSRIYGLTDAVVAGQTGWLHEPGNIDDIADYLDHLLGSPAKLAFSGHAANAFVKKYFAEAEMVEKMLTFYKLRMQSCKAY